MNIAVEMVLPAQQKKNPVDLLHRFIRRTPDPRAQKEPLDIVAPIKLDRQPAKFLRRKRCTDCIIRAAVDAIFAVIDAFIGHQYFQ